jgi:hypothetical protein
MKAQPAGDTKYGRGCFEKSTKMRLGSLFKAYFTTISNLPF